MYLPETEKMAHCSKRYKHDMVKIFLENKPFPANFAIL